MYKTQIKLFKSITVRGSRWSHISVSTLGDRYITLYRHPSRSMLKRQGSVVTGIDVPRTELPHNRQSEIAMLLHCYPLQA